jgi:hypothetical protein
MWIYQKTTTVAAGTTYNVGFYAPNGILITVSAETTEPAAQALVSYLNGGTAPA